MPTTTNNLNDHGTVLVEHSDPRLAAVEEAKRTGQEFQSVGTKGADIVNREAVIVATREVSNEGSTDPNVGVPDYLVTLKENVDDFVELNKQKAQEHSDVSAEIVAAQQKSEVSDREKLRKDPKYFVKKIIALNNKLAADYADEISGFAADDEEVRAVASRETARLRVESLGDHTPATSLGKRALDKPTDISESFAAEALQTKDRIIYGEESYKAQAKSDRKTDAEAGTNKAQKAEKTDEPLRVEETTRKTKPVDQIPANQVAVDQAPVPKGGSAPKE